ncbi:hypothetical protein RHSIM_Rhsim03G0020800 [Rhododendron simsii]|uniref:AAA+ ATPase domain-containing protein n=1 Tax=Rhododendron simsii TaxID=118357 RepID=A0A834LRF3_RHOSS|nr:hypothetical protein RHSIM_Rhsim03G0020800 [Rhododendron simsii]
MCIPQNIIERLVCGAFDEAVKAGKYVLQYRTNLDKLRTEMRSLEDRRAIIERKVHEAVDHGKEIEIAVLHWQADTDKVKNYVQDLIEQSTAEAKMHCFACSCPNIKWRYRLGKQAEEKIADVKTLAQESHFDEISHPEPPPPPELEFPSAENYVHLDSRTPIFEAILGALNDPKVEMIGVYGRGGVGKTTLVKKVAKKMLDDGTFKQVLLVVVSKDLHVKEIQKKLADGLNFALDAKDEKGRANELCHKFKNGEKYLVILDDIWEKVDLKAIGIPVMEGNIGCKVVLTSRKEDLLRITMKADRNFPIGELPEEEGWILFKKKLGNTIESWPEINSLAREVCRKCNGLPVAINALGAALEDRPYHAWKNALDKLDRHMLTQIEGIDPSVLASLSVSFDMLHSSDAQSCFLLCCLFAEDVEILIDELTRHCMARSLLTQNPRTFDEARTAMCIVVDVLKSASLLSTSDHETIVKIPDVIRDIGISIAREKEAFLVDHSALRWPRNPTNGPSYKAISLNFKSIKGLPDGLVYPQLETLMVDHGELSDLEVPDNFFNGMIHLKVLTFTRMTLRQLPSSLAKLANLRMLHLNHCELVDLAILRDLKTNLEVLGLRSSTIKALPQEIRELTNLRVLDLIDCDDLKVIPQGVISNLTSLEELYFPSTFKEWEVTSDKKQETSNSNNVSLEELRWLLSTGQLTTLHIHIPDVMLLPKDILMFQNLKRFRISSSNFKINENFQRRKVVDKADHVLYLSGVKGLENILHDNEDGNVSLEFDYHPNEQSSILQSHEMHWLNSFNRLIVLHISNCKTKYLFSQSTARGLVHLEELVVQSCERMEEIVGFEGQNDEEELTSELKFRKLKRLVLQFLPNFISFYSKKEKVETTMGSSSASAQPLFNEKVILPVLEVLEVDRLGNIVEIWDKQSLWLNERMHIVSFGKLRDVKVQRCEKLMKLVPSNILPRLDELQKLCVEGCPKIESVVFENEEEAADDRTLIIPQLQYLRISEMELLKSFYSSFTASNAQSLFNHQV